MPQSNKAMNTATFDTYQIVKSLTKAGANEPLALAVVDAVKAGISGGVATHEDVLDVKAQINEVKAELTAEINGVRTELTAEINGVKAELTAEINDVRTELTAEINGVKVELTAEIHEIKTRLDRLERTLLFRIGGLIVALAAIFKAIEFLV